MFPQRAESVDSFSANPATGQPEAGKRTSDSPRALPGQSTILPFPARGTAPVRNPVFDYGDTAPKTRNRRNPLRGHLTSVSIAIVEANKLEHTPGMLDWIREGAASARVLADEFDRILEIGRTQQ
ncbi:hypothetical protein [Bradyrhizobium canariense]|uniref:hypothetical protein n=1 Tax=Bradyrhizobium canariense TaxID=255045 RepID=UPI000A18E03D|nr:hypothetical protein [Bradyrhizobium canariense]OSI22849.1 hypothetical protein BST65_22890 [Bradyrhizobium canariense]OSI30207.1 hypothetical protein BST66_24835 [Bradyrhizobium canariense]OSI38519.1 hypothetical protein BSZ20_36885 [Bradyrhizobium canariense]OSI46866.1 hypothetical protein BST67_24130 [Bradyrhizobium canariense]OSI50902.1 hypothetical protein BSZ15_32620 [Bradyrhizobium canariense]